jgi:hypothetical protein
MSCCPTSLPTDLLARSSAPYDECVLAVAFGPDGPTVGVADGNLRTIIVPAARLERLPPAGSAGIAQ